MPSSPVSPPVGSAPRDLRCVLVHAPGAELPGELLTSLSKRIGNLLVCTTAYAAMAEVCTIERSRLMLPAGTTPPVRGRPTGVLVLVEPRSISGAGELVDAVQKYAPQTACWWYERGARSEGDARRANPRLEAVVDEDVQSWSQMRRPIRTPPLTHQDPAAPALQPVIRPAAIAELVRARGGERGTGGSVEHRTRPNGAPSGSPHLRIAGDPGEEHGGVGGRGGGGAGGMGGMGNSSGSLLNDEELRMLLSDDPHE